MPQSPIARTIPPTACLLLSVAGLALAPAAARGQADPLGEPFPAALSLSELDGRIGFRLNGVDLDDDCGQAVAPAGDVNGDGIADLIIGAPLADPGGRDRAGSAFVVFGRDTAVGASFPAELQLEDLDGSNGFRLDGIANSEAGDSVASAGDVNGDGICDIIVGARFTSKGGEFNVGSSYVVFGRAAGNPFPARMELADLDGVSGFRIDGVADDDSSGSSVASAGDVNGDGIADVIIGAPRADARGLFNAGASYVVFGRDPSSGAAFPAVLSLSDLDGSNGFTLHGVEFSDYAGYRVATLGDVDGDGLSDIGISAPYAEPGGRVRAGSTYVVFGRDTTSGSMFPAVLELAELDGSDGFRIDGASERENSGASIAAAGDVNGDGVGDIIIGAHTADPGGELNSGSSYVVFGRNTMSGVTFPAVFDLASVDGTNGVRLDGVAERDFSGYAVASTGDTNGDGLDDVIIGAFGADPGYGGNYGASFVVYGRDTRSTGGFPAAMPLASLNGSNGFRLDGPNPLDHIGRSVAPAGDINGDGLDDLIIGAPDSRGAYISQTGASFVIFGRRQACPADLDGDGTLTIFDFLAFQNLFDAMDPAADFDGDGAFTIFDFLAFQNAFDAGCP